jgi:hypothetical protein
MVSVYRNFTVNNNKPGHGLTTLDLFLLLGGAILIITENS